MTRFLNMNNMTMLKDALADGLGAIGGVLELGHKNIMAPLFKTTDLVS